MDILELLLSILAIADSNEQRAEWAGRAAMLEAAQKFYRGEHPLPFGKWRSNEPDPNVIVNLCAPIVNRSVAWMFGDPDSLAEKGGVDFELTGAQPGGAEETYIRAVIKAAGGSQFFQRLGRRGSVNGHNFVKILPATDKANTTGLPRLIVLKPDAVQVITRDDDTDSARAYVIEWMAERRLPGRVRPTETTIRQVFALTDDGTNTWALGQFYDTGRIRNKWVVDEGFPPPAIWPYKWLPIVDWQNQISTEYYGLSDLEDVTALNMAINTILSNSNRILYIHGHPRTIGTGFSAGDVQESNIDSFWTIPDKEAKVYNLEMQSDLSSAYNMVQMVARWVGEISRDFDVATLEERIGQLTNFGLRVLASSALAKLSEKRQTYGDGLARINRALLELGGFTLYETKIHWSDPLPQNEDEEVKRLKDERGMGIVSKQTATQERGRDWELEQKRIAEEEALSSGIGARILDGFMGGRPSVPGGGFDLPIMDTAPSGEVP